MTDLAELILLFAGEPDGEGGYLTAPCPSLPLALELCRQVQPASMVALVRAVFGGWPQDSIPAVEAHTLSVAYGRWRHASVVGRGL